MSIFFSTIFKPYRSVTEENSYELIFVNVAPFSLSFTAKVGRAKGNRHEHVRPKFHKTSVRSTQNVPAVVCSR